jgi:hypothetical protein
MREPVALEELNATRLLGEVRPWVESLCSRYKNPDWCDHFVKKRGLSNRLQGELVPLAQLRDRLAPERPESRLKYFPGSGQSFDAHILAADNFVQEVLEVTLACDGYRDAIAGECLKKYGWAPLWIPLAYSGRRNARELPLPKMQSKDTEQIVEDGLTLIRNAVGAKSASGKYESVSLVVGLEDFRFLDRHFEYVKSELQKTASAFKVVYYVGLDGRFFFTQIDSDR